MAALFFPQPSIFLPSTPLFLSINEGSMHVCKRVCTHVRYCVCAGDKLGNWAQPCSNPVSISD